MKMEWGKVVSVPALTTPVADSAMGPAAASAEDELVAGVIDESDRINPNQLSVRMMNMSSAGSIINLDTPAGRGADGEVGSVPSRVGTGGSPDGSTVVTNSVAAAAAAERWW